MVLINSGGAAGSGSGAKPEVPKLPKEADTAEPGKKPTLPKPKVPEPVVTYTPQAMALQRAARTGAALCDI
jgi:type VI secretion system secreted protein VgrG